MVEESVVKAAVSPSPLIKGIEGKLPAKEDSK